MYASLCGYVAVLMHVPMHVCLYVGFVCVMYVCM